MRKTAFVCLGSDKEHNPLIYQELPRRENGEEFFVFFSPVPVERESLLRELFREAISFSRLGHPLHYFHRFLQRFKERTKTFEVASEVLANVRLTVMIRQGEEVFLLTQKGANAMHWDGSAAAPRELSSYPGASSIPLKEDEGQRDLFAQPVEDLFVLRHFRLEDGNHTILLMPSKGFYERYGEAFKNSVLFPSFETPSGTGIDVEAEITFPAIHWNTMHRVVGEVAAKPRRRISVPMAVGFTTLVIVLLLLFIPRQKAPPLDARQGQEPLLGVAEGTGEGTKAEERAAVPASRTATPQSGERSLSFVESWKKGFEAPVTSSPTYCGGKIVFGCRDGSIYSFSEAGEMIWQYRTGDGIGASPLCIAGKVIGANYSGDVVCLDGETGAKLWSFAAKDRIVSNPQVRDDVVIVGTMGGNLIALKMKDGSRLWAKKIGDAIWAGTTIGKDYVIAATTDGSVVKFDRDGKMLWSAKPGGGIRSTPLCMETGDLVVFGTEDKYVYGYSLSGGALMWRYLCGGKVNAPPVVAESSIMIGSEDGNLYALSMTGQLLWRTPLGGSILSKPFVLGEKVFVTTYSSKLYAVDAKSGEIIGEFGTSSPIYSSPHVGGDRVFFGSNGGVFYSVWIYGGKS
jgi:outer membrane protein assembly factor BamB